MRRLLAFLVVLTLLAGGRAWAQDDPPPGLSDDALIAYFEMAPRDVGFLALRFRSTVTQHWLDWTRCLYLSLLVR